MGTLNRHVGASRGLLAMALGLIAGNFIANGMSKADSLMAGHRLKYSLDNHWRTIRGKNGSTAAAHKRAAKKLRNIRARSKK